MKAFVKALQWMVSIATDFGFGSEYENHYIINNSQSISNYEVISKVYKETSKIWEFSKQMV